MKYFLTGVMSNPDSTVHYPGMKELAERLRSRHHDIVSPHELTRAADDTYDKYVRHDLREMLTCDALLLSVGWEDSRAARLALTVADKCNMYVFQLDESDEIKFTVYGDQDTTKVSL